MASVGVARVRGGRVDGEGRAPSRAERKRREVLDAARRRFLDDGYAGAGMEAVARDAGVSTATLYSYFPSKADLFRAVLTDATAALADRLLHVEAADGPAERQLGAFAAAYARFWADPYPRALFRLLSAERRRFADAAAHFDAQARLGPRAVLLRMLGQLRLKGELAMADPDLAAGQLMGMVEHATLTYGLAAGEDAPPPVSADRLATEAVDTFLARYRQG